MTRIIILVSQSEAVVLADKQGHTQLAFIRVPPAQLRLAAPTIYERCKEQAEIGVLLMHADPAGNINEFSMDAFREMQPQAVFCCYPVYARRNYPHLPIVGHGRETVKFVYDPLSPNILRLEITGDMLT